VRVTPERHLPRFGALAGSRVAGRQGLYRVETVIEKPTPTEAEQRLVTPGLRAGYYLCLFGMHVLTPLVMEVLGEQIAKTPMARSYSLRLWPSWRAALSIWLWKKRPPLRFRNALWVVSGPVRLALSGPDQAEILALLVETLAVRESSGLAGSAK